MILLVTKRDGGTRKGRKEIKRKFRVAARRDERRRRK